MKRQKRDWAKIVEEQRKSGRPIKAFCELKGIHPNTFYMKRKLFDRQELVEISIHETAEVKIHPILIQSGSFSVHIHPGFDQDCLKSVLEVIGDIR